MKAGTTSLQRYLSLHLQIFMSKRKELNFFAMRIPWRASRAVRWAFRVGSSLAGKPDLGLEDDLRLQRILKPDVIALRAFLGDELPEWRPYA